MSFRTELVEKVIFPLSSVRTHVRKHLSELEGTQWLTLEKLRELQWKKIGKLVHHASLEVPYYKALFNQLGLTSGRIESFEDFCKIPLLTKESIRQNFNQLIARNYSKLELVTRTTSGSAGAPVTIVRDKKASRIAAANQWRFKRWAGQGIGERTASIWRNTVPPQGCVAVASRNGRLLGSRIKSWLENCLTPDLRLDPTEAMTEEAMEGFFQAIKDEDIQILHGYVSPLFFFAQFLLDRHEGELRMKAVRTFAEVLHPHQRTVMERAFGCQVFNVYASRELELIASECQHHTGLHVNAEGIFIELLDADGSPCRQGIGEIVVTDLNNYAMPLIRYQIGDIGEFSDMSCPCGRGLPLLSSVKGRTIDMLSLSDDSKVHGTVVTGFMFSHWERVQRFRAVQKRAGEIDLFLQFSSPPSEDLLSSIRKGLEDLTQSKLQVHTHVVDQLPLEDSGKYKFVSSEIS